MEELEPLFAEWADSGHASWNDALKASAADILDPTKNGHMPKWLETIESLPAIDGSYSNFHSPAVTVDGVYSDEQQEQVRNALRVFHPWRKGPFELFGVSVDAEWRSDLKWQRVAPHISLDGLDVLDVGCGNGYYGWRMLGAGARRVIGVEPYPLYNLQYRAIKNYVADSQNFVLPANDRILRPEQPKFDATFSMGVFYHCKNPIGHLEALRNTLKSGGSLMLETLVVEGDVERALIPGDRYAKMRNVWLIPSTLMLEQLLRRCGFRDIAVVDVTNTTPEEQRPTDWMTYESLADFLDPGDGTKTIEGYPSPRRAIVVATKR